MSLIYWAKCACHCWPLMPTGKLSICGECGEPADRPCEEPADGKAYRVD